MPVETPVRALTLAVAGNPNSGKSTLFNRLTGLRQPVGNYAGVTVERSEGLWAGEGFRIRLVDLPGTYALSPQSEEQRVAIRVILGQDPAIGALDGVLVVVDSTCLEKSLYLALQIMETGVPVLLVLNMADELAMRGAELDVSALARWLDVPVVQISATGGDGLARLKAAVLEWVRVPPARRPAVTPLPLPNLELATRRRTRIKAVVAAVTRAGVRPHPWTDRVDRWVMHRVAGPLIFAAVVLLVFQAMFAGARPMMELVDRGCTALAVAIRAAGPPGLATSFLADGVVAGVGAVVTFLPQILIVFFCLAVLEHSGYLARAALIMDRLMRRIGLQGKSFLPLISSYACAVPGVLATRTIENKRDRLATMCIAPFMTCSARLPVYTLLISAFIPDRPLLGRLLGLRAATLLGLYALGFGAALLTAWGLKSTILRSDRTPFTMEVPPYRAPQLKVVLLILWDRARVFLQQAGTVILAVSIVMWVLVSFPRPQGQPDLSASAAGRLGTLIEPVLEPLGFNWRIGVGLVFAQVAREVIVSTLATTYRVSEADGETRSLQQALRIDITPLAAVSLMVFFALAMQCTSTLAVVRRETGGWGVPAALFVYMNALAYGASFVVYQGGRWLGFA